MNFNFGLRLNYYLKDSKSSLYNFYDKLSSLTLPNIGMKFKLASLPNLILIMSNYINGFNIKWKRLKNKSAIIRKSIILIYYINFEECTNILIIFLYTYYSLTIHIKKLLLLFTNIIKILKKSIVIWNTSFKESWNVFIKYSCKSKFVNFISN